MGDTIGSYFAMDAGAASATSGGTTGGTPAANGATAGGGTNTGGSTMGGGTGAATTGAVSGGTGANTGSPMPGDPDASVDPGATGNPPAPMPLPQGVLISEIMPRPDGGGAHEWIEIWNGSDKEIDLDGCTISTGGTSRTSSFTVTGSVKVAAKAYAVLAREDAESQNGITATYVYEHFYMGPSESLTLECAGAMVDTLTYDNASYQASLQLDARYVTALKNDDLSAWCDGSTPLPRGDGLGSPGAANTSCAGVAAP